MSYDVSLEVQSGPKMWATVYDANHTSNTSGMWRTAGCDIAEYDGRSAESFGLALGAAISVIESDPETFLAMEPDNLWGSMQSTLNFLHELYDATQQHPYTQVSVWH